ncbi:subtilisin-like protease-like protein [Decorospora gaudefroyi]|uniref:Subtilisin-like protease-like protein n=1 Tax=Decorospora gaudefroyi TaxID=184978 RepID=A0A6A5KA51_9PLEO|nr:subtilisin-like protease-like protein [Decorospora gaudefroyi]KAF1832512.1 subtilisin-like protease-like protein [Decorospora gaudefroyi]
MHFFACMLAFVGIFIPFFVQAAPFSQSLPSNAIDGKYIVVLKPDTDVASVVAHVNAVRRLARRDEAVERQYDMGHFKGYAGSFDAATAEELKSLPEVLLVEPDYMMYTASLVQQSNAPWGLGSISSRTNGATSYIFDSSAGQGTYSYVLDTGIRTTHVEFEGRATWGYNALNDGVNTDTNGHGTHVAGILGSKTYGVAKKTNLIAVKVLTPNGPTALSIVLDGLNWALNDIVSKGRQTSAVITMAFGGPASSAMDNAITSINNSGVIAVVAAGNDMQPASNSSPCRASVALCVGAIQPNDYRSSYSNYGPAVDIWAPGDNIVSTWITSDTATSAQYGTSMATPFVAGLVSYIRGKDGLSPGPIARAKVLALATPGRVLDGQGAANLMAYNGNGR